MKLKSLLYSCLVVVLIAGFVAWPAAAQSGSTVTCTRYHTVQRGEYLSLIGRTYGVSWRWLAEINNLANPSRIYTGQRICVETKTTPDTTPAACKQYHTVKRGEYLSLIGKTYGVSWRWLAEINNLANPSRIYTGQRICVATSGTVTPTPTPNPPSSTPSFTILSVVQDQTVTIQTRNFPARETFEVLMGHINTQAVGGLYAGTIETGRGGSILVTFDIPAGLRGANRIAIRLESQDSRAFAYNWFYNSTTGQ